MARHGIAYKDVVGAVNQLIAQQKNPTIEQIRILIGSGSSTTIANHLRAWKNQQSQTDLLAAKEALPIELVGGLKNLWLKLLEAAENKITIAKNQDETIIAELQTELAKLQQEINHLRTQQNNSNKANQYLLQEKSFLEKSLDENKNQIAKLVAEKNGLVAQVNEKEKSIQEFHHIYHLTQENLTNLQQTIREERLLADARYSQQEKKYIMHIKELQKQLLFVEREKTAWQLQAKKLKGKIQKIKVKNK